MVGIKFITPKSFVLNDLQPIKQFAKLKQSLFVEKKEGIVISLAL